MNEPALNGAEQSVSKARLRLWLKLLKASSLIEDEIRRRLRNEFNWTLPRFDVMSALARSPDGLKMSEISQMLRVSNGNITGIVDKLSEEGLALRVAVPGDRRANLVRLTPKGQDVFTQHAEVHEAWIDEILSGLDAEDVDGMIGRLDRLSEALEEGK
ncbi:MarR family transcriptional regulator [Roseibium porphyridii]|uniref:MarR family transcriptional regulator n=1 Tax=Roseibium porphyridii TaxID=2866279 RepID=A0ABY8F6D9_9HYPH|nr:MULTISPECIES: MarR family transcriptional regulator [Stappiaceae]QFT30420.1 HTH-type transcriptional regulator MhqR [Labrenzia sp. THAF82]WFE91063.1 MarR family transcriptional regulator [Roseibium sp. KMA01]